MVENILFEWKGVVKANQRRIVLPAL